jgi:hypothetical protein
MATEILPKYGYTEQHVKTIVAINYAKWDAATKWCRRQGLTFRVVTEDDIFRNGSK